MVENKGGDKNGEFRDLIKDLRIRMENDAKQLKKLEEKGTEDDAVSALWISSGGWNGGEYRKIEQELRNRGHTSRSGI